MSDVIQILNEISHLMHLSGENHFKIQAFEKAAKTLEGREDLKTRAESGTLEELPGIGKGIAHVVGEYLLTGRSVVLENLKAALPQGLTELSEIPGLGAKKAKFLIEQLDIHSIGELEYACKENRLLNLRGFGPKSQKKILESIQFQKVNQAFLKLSDTRELTKKGIALLKELFPGKQVMTTGALRRQLEVVNRLDFLIESESPLPAQISIGQQLHEAFEEIRCPIPVQFHFTDPKNLGYRLAKTTATEGHWEAIGAPEKFSVVTEEEFYEKLGLPWISPELRETGEEVALAKRGLLDSLLSWHGVKGVFHNHTVRSDGSATLEEMVKAAEDHGYEYIGISDHSQSAFYAQGLKESTLLEQESEIKKVQKKHPNIRIFWGIESDILADGSLDYPDEVLKKFDFVIASVHSRFKMDRKAMTQRIVSALRSPYTRFLGHPTGRLLLGRAGYELDMEEILSVAADEQVAVELNANPVRLDIDWRWGGEMRKKGTVTSVNPDAHETAGLEDVHYGVIMARKALLPATQVINSRSTQEVEKWLKRRS